MEDNRINENKSHCNSRIWLGIILVFLGGIFLLNNMNLINFNIPQVIFSWPSFMIIIGVIILAKSRNIVLGAGLVIVGAFFLLPRIFPWIQYERGLFVPLILILLGIYILVKRNTSGNRGFKKNFNSEDRLGLDRIDDVSIFGGGNKIISSKNFQGGTITAIFGGSEIDLTTSVLAPGKNVIDILCLFGGTTIIVPKEWNVQTDVFALFGGFSNKGLKNTDVNISQENTLIVKGIALFGGGEVKRY